MQSNPSSTQSRTAQRQRARAPARGGKAGQRRSLMMRGVIACALFVTPLAATWLLGTSSIFSPKVDGLSRAAGKTSQPPADAYRSGWIVHQLSDGTNCRYHRFDNVAGWISDGTEVDCDTLSRQRRKSGSQASTPRG